MCGWGVKNIGLALFSPLSLTDRPLLGCPYFLNEKVLAKCWETRVVSLTLCCFWHWISNQYWLLSATSRWNVRNNSLPHILESSYFWVLDLKRTRIQYLGVFFLLKLQRFLLRWITGQQMVQEWRSFIYFLGKSAVPQADSQRGLGMSQ